MSNENDLSNVISGSFSKFKPEIDLTIDEFTELGVTVLAPNKGWLYKPPLRRFQKEDLINFFRPLPSEIGMRIKEIEDAFLASLRKSDFVYVVNPEGFIGTMVSFEIGYALASNVPIYSQRQILDQGLISLGYISGVKIFTPKEAAIDAKKLKLLKTQAKTKS
jgi:hypothetical protein